jgi:hypothetical protein
MATNLERFKGDLERLQKMGHQLEMAMIHEVDPKGFVEQATIQLGGKDKADAFVKELPNFRKDYEGWYSESIALIRQVLPDRLHTFVALYEKPRPRKALPGYSEYVIEDFMDNLRVTFGGDVKADSSAAIPKFRQQRAILSAAEKRFESSLFDIRKIVQSDLFDTELDSARELASSKYLRAAGAVAGVVLEKHLHEVCNSHKIKITKKHPSIGDLNELLKQNAVIEIPQWRQISFLADLRNLCDHHKAKEPTEEQITDLIEGTSKILKTIT